MITRGAEKERESDGGGEGAEKEKEQLAEMKENVANVL